MDTFFKRSSVLGAVHIRRRARWCWFGENSYASSYQNPAISTSRNCGNWMLRGFVQKEPQSHGILFRRGLPNGKFFDNQLPEDEDAAAPRTSMPANTAPHREGRLRAYLVGHDPPPRRIAVVNQRQQHASARPEPPPRPQVRPPRILADRAERWQQQR